MGRLCLQCSSARSEAEPLDIGSQADHKNQLIINSQLPIPNYRKKLLLIRLLLKLLLLAIVALLVLILSRRAHFLDSRELAWLRVLFLPDRDFANKGLRSWKHWRSAAILPYRTSLGVGRIFSCG